MAAVEDRVISIKFDNAGFEAKILQTQRTLDQLKRNLDFTMAQRSMGDLGRAAGQVNLEPVAASTDGISAKFVAMSAIAITALTQITSRAIDAGARISSALTIDPVKQGFEEYETNMNSIQTILANTDSKGSTLEDVNASLDELNRYSDQTIYNFSQMARNIGTFTAAGVDLDTSTASIKGIANLAAISGSNSQQASTAMYQLSQAIASGSVKLMDWNSVVNAGMGGEVFQKALFESGKAMGTLADVPIDQTFEEWTDAGNTFRGSLQDGWLTSEVLTSTLQGFTGDLTEAQIMSMGYTKEQAAEMLRLGQIGKAAATEVKTLTQLAGTVKESIASGWASSFRTVIGDFAEAKQLWTGVNNYIGGVVGRSADARNKMLAEWKAFGGRDSLINSLRTGWQGILTIITPIRDAFRNIFPKQTTAGLIALTASFAKFVDKIALSTVAQHKLQVAFRGVFAGVKIVWEVVKGVVGVFKELFDAIAPSSDSILDLGNSFGASMYRLYDFLVLGGALERFFDNVGSYIRPAVDGIKDFVMSIAGIEIGNLSFGVIGERFGGLARGIGTAAGWIADRIRSLGGIFQNIVEFVRPKVEKLLEIFGEFKDRLTEAFDGGDFSAVMDLLNLGLIAGLIVAVRRVRTLFGDLNFNFGGGVIDAIRGSFDQLTGTLSAMQANLKANALMKIAIAIGILTLSIVTLSLIDSAALSQALGAIAVGFGQLVAAMALMTKVDMTGAKLAGIAIGLILLSGAVLLLSIAVRMMAGLTWEELATGLAGVTGLLGALVAALHLMPTEKMAVTSLQLLGIGIALNVMALAVRQFSGMEWEEMGRGLAGVAASMAILVAGIQAMPTEKMAMSGFQILLVAVALNVMALAVKQFANMELKEMGEGLLGVAASMVILAAGLQAMPDKKMLITGASLLIVAIALNVMGLAVKIFASMDMEELGRGLGAIAAMLLILSVATNSMTSAIAGALSMIIIAGALRVLADVMLILGDMSMGQIGGALLALAGVLVVLGLAAVGATYIAPGLILLAASLIAIGAGFALIGAGAYLAARAFEIFGDAGEKGVEAFKAIVMGFLSLIPQIAGAVSLMVLNIIAAILDGLPAIIESLQTVLQVLLESLTELLPAVGEFLSELIAQIIQIIDDNLPNLIETGFKILDALLTGWDQNIEEITTRVISIITKIMDTLTAHMPMLTEAGANLIIGFIGGIQAQIPSIVAAVAGLIIALIQGITVHIPQITEAARNLIIQFLLAIANMVLDIVNAGANILIQLLYGIASKIIDVINAAAHIITTIIYTLASKAGEIVTAGANALASFLQGIADNIITVVYAGADMVTQLISGITSKINDVVSAGADAIVDFLRGVANNINMVITSGVKIVLSFLKGIADNAIRLASAGADLVIDFLNGVAKTIETKAPELREAGRRIATAIIDGMTGGLLGKARDVASTAVDVAQGAIGAVAGAIGAKSPATEFIKLGEFADEGFAVGLSNGKSERSASDLAKRSMTSFRGSIKRLADKMVDLDDISPVIAPVLDLSRVEAEAGRLSGMMDVGTIVPTVSYEQARYLQHTNDAASQADAVTVPDSGPSVMNFEQHIYSPRPLGTADIYRNTKSQIALAKEELGLQ